MLNKIKRGINHFCRQIINWRHRQRLQNQGMSVIASNCNGALILHDLGQKFYSPFVNLYLTPADFIRYLQHIDHYQQCSLRFIQTQPYPIALLDNIRLHFMHYHSREEAEKKWQQRTARINFNNLFIMMTDRDGCTYQDLEAFEQLPYPNKVVFTHKNYPEFSSAFYIKGFEDQKQVGDLFEYSGYLGKKYYDQFDYVNWFNQPVITQKIHQKP